MKLKRFEALTLQEALQAVKAELGLDAVIISTRRISKNGGIFGLLTQQMIEVTAAVDPPKSREHLPQLPIPDMVQREVTAQERLARTLARYESPKEEAVQLAPPTFEEHFQAATLLDPLTEQLTALRAEVKGMQEGGADTFAMISPLRQEIEQVRTMMEGLVSDRVGSRVASFPAPLQAYYQVLMNKGISPEFSYGLLRSVSETLGESGLTQEDMVEEVLKEKMAQALTVSGPLTAPGDVPKMVMLVGPTGVGKTTTVAKLASHFSQRIPNVKTVIITVDTYRVAAVEQLRVFARILKVPLEVAVTPDELPACVARHRDAGLILIDTAGRSPLDPVGQQELLSLSRKDMTLETHLVLAAPTAPSVLHEMVRHYAGVPIHRLLFSKLDENPNFGPMVNLAHQTGLPVSYLTTGQRVPEDMEEARVAAMVERMGLSQAVGDIREGRNRMAMDAA